MNTRIAMFLMVFLAAVMCGTVEAEPLEIVTPDSGQVQMLTTRDGSVIVGRIVDFGPDSLTFETRYNRIPIPLSDVRRLNTIAEHLHRNGTYWHPNPNASRLLFAPTGRTLRKGQGYIADHLLFFPSVTFGLDDRITLGAGVSLFPAVSLDEQIFYLTPKLALYQSENVNFSTGALLIRPPDWEGSDTGVAGIHYGVGTFGTIDKSLTIGAGYGWADGASQGMIMVGGESRMSKNISLITENWFWGDQPLISYGLRFIGERMTVDFALVNTIGDEAIFPGVPYIDFVFNFGY